MGIESDLESRDMSKNAEYIIPFESYKKLVEIQGLADGVNGNAEEIYEYDAQELSRELLTLLREIRQKTSEVFQSARRVE